MCPDQIMHNGNCRKCTADQTVCDIRFVLYKGSQDQSHDNSDQQYGRDFVFHFCPVVRVHRLPVLPEQDHHDRDRHQSTQFHGKKHARFSLHPEEIQEIHFGISTKHDRSRITHQRGRSL